VLVWAGTASAQEPTQGLEATLRCGPADQPADLMACLGDTAVKISREGVKTVAVGDDVLALGDLEDGALHITGPRYFSIEARNLSPDHTLFLTVSREDGPVVLEQSARRFGTVAFYRCGPTVEFNCREYNYQSN